jgi:SAM-dependent methyltransferase
MSDWWIFPPPGHGGHGKPNRNHKQGYYSKRQLVRFPYKVDDEVYVMVPQKIMERFDVAGKRLGGNSAADNQALPNFAFVTNNSNINKRTVLIGRVVKVTIAEEDAHHDTETAPTNKSVNAATNASTSNTNSNISSKTVVFVDVVLPSTSSVCTHRSVLTTPLVFNEQEQQRFLQPRFAVTKVRDDSNKSNMAVVVLVQETAPFRRLIEFQLYQGNLGFMDRVLEIGCSTGELSQRIWNMGVGAWVGIDNSAEMVSTCSRQLERYHIGTRSTYNVLRIDPMLEPQRAYNETIQALGGFPTVVCLDIGGNREFRPVIDVLSWVFQMFVLSNSSDVTDDELRQPLRLILVKSRALVRSILQDGANGNVRIDYPTGLVSFGHDWLESVMKHGQRKSEVDGDDQRLNRQTLKRITHPAKAPMAYSPTDDRTPICRYHNYHPKGCKRRNYATSPCELDHDHCHACRKPGHIALNCTEGCSCY